MSTKIYRAWRFPRTQINAFIMIVDRWMFGKALGRVKEFMAAVKPKFAAERARKIYGSDFCKREPGKQAKLVYYARFDRAMETFRKVSEGTARIPPLDLDCGVSLWIHGRHAYAVPYGEEWLVEGIRMPRWVEDYAYWDNADPPKGMGSGAGYRRWVARGRTWDRVCLDDWNATRLQHDVVSLRKGEAAASMARLQMTLFPISSRKRGD